VSADPIHALIPLPEEKTGLLSRLVDGLDQASLHWLSGYAAGLAARIDAPTREVLPLAAVGSTPQTRLTIVFGSQTGNAKRLAEALAREAENAGLAVRVVRADAYPLRELKAERLLYIVISTQGEGDPPDDSSGFVEFIASKRAPQLADLKFAVLGLGDTSYAKFCAVGADLDARLAELGATRLIARGDADVDIETVAKPWTQRALTAAREILKTTQTATVTPLRPARAAIAWTRERPFAAEVLANQRITARDGTRDIRHIELSLRDSGLSYEPGDALGVWATNPAPLADSIIEALKLDAQTPVALDEQTLPLRDWLIEKKELTKLSRPFLVAHAERVRNPELDASVTTQEGVARLLAEYQPIDLLRAFPAEWNALEFIAALRPMTPRMYSIASSLKAVEDEAHLTVARIDYRKFGRDHVGGASHYLATRADDARVPIFIEANDRFRLPQDSSRDIIMIGPGTGVAPFRAFVQERAALGASGKNWLFFGNQHFHADFLYQVEWQQALKRGELHRLDLAFSRDQTDKIYVQQRIRQSGREIYDWLERGAHIYVCGDATHMAKDVHAALRDAIAIHGGKSAEDAETYLTQLATERRYARDVY
jgi:sulfite reductase (NADPH) flavoprotein alpha-component